MGDVKRTRPLIIKIPVPLWLRLFFAAIGLFAICVPTWELHRGVWPPNWGSPFFLFIILGAWTVGFPAMLAALTGWAVAWSIEPGRIRIVQRNPFAIRRHRFAPRDIDRIEVMEREAMEGDNTFLVRLVTVSGKQFETQDFQKRPAAERCREEIEAAFRV